MRPRRLLALIALSLVGHPALAAAAISFVPGHFYTTNYFSPTITEYDANGAKLGAIALAEQELKGLAFWPDGITADANGYVYVADHGNNRIQKFSCP